MSTSLSRRDFLRFGSVALGGLGIPFALGAANARCKAQACILLYMDGGPSHIDLWDLKPNAPADVRGPFTSIASSVPGIRVCEHLPRVAQQMHHLVQVRSVRHDEAVHDPAVYQMLTGTRHPSSAGNLTVQPSDAPHIATVFGMLDRSPAAMPKVIELPETMKMGGRILPGQNGGYLGVRRDPFRVAVLPDCTVVPPEFKPRADVPFARLDARSRLLQTLDQRLAALEHQGASTDFASLQQQAVRLLSTPTVRRAFDLEQEPDRVRDNYGRHRHGQSVLLARRLVESGARFVTVYWGKEKQDWADGRGPMLANNPWDTHRNHFPLLKETLLPRADRAFAALVDDLHVRGLLNSTLVVWMGDFGRTPRIDRKFASRDHWPHANTILFAGAGTPGGAVIGKTDRLAAEVIDDPVSPADVHATILHLLGIHLRGTLADAQGRPQRVSTGVPISALFS